MLDHLDDLESDFSAIHRVDDIYALDGPRFFRLAFRISAYEGVMRVRIEQQEAQPAAAPTAVSSPPRTAGHDGLAAVAAQHPDLIERVVVS